MVFLSFGYFNIADFGNLGKSPFLENDDN